MKITDPEMVKKFERAIKEARYEYSLEDIEAELETGDMQSHCVGNSWALTQVHGKPGKRTVSIVLFVGDMKDSYEMEKAIEKWAKGIEAHSLTAVGREGWWEFKTPGWEKTGVRYYKELAND